MRSAARAVLRHVVWFLRRQLLSWKGRRRLASGRALFAALVAIPLFVVFLSSVVRPLGLDSWWIEKLDSRCENRGFACNALTEVLGLVFAVSAGFLIFLALRLSRVKKRYIQEIRNRPERLFPSWTGTHEIVGRDPLCGLIDDDFALNGFSASKRDERHRRPRIIVGDIGSGKTGVLVRLAQILAQRGAVPVPVRLRAARGELDFVTLARAEFMRRTERFVLVEDEGDRIWRWLLETGSIVILADGLEEALLESRARETRVRQAIKDAMNDGNVPIVVSSRPAPYLATLDAALIRLEPLPAESAVDALTGVLGDRDRAQALVANAGVSSMPFALELLRDLAKAEQLRGLDRLSGVNLRRQLLDRWLELKIRQSQLWREESDANRAAATRTLEALAALGLQQDSLAVTSEALASSPWRAALLGSSTLNSERAVRLAAGIDLVEETGDGVRFKSNLIQAYLGSRALPRLLAWSAPEDFLGNLEDAPARELLMAIVFAYAGGLDEWAEELTRNWLVTRAEDNALRDDTRLAMLAAAAEVEQLRWRSARSVTDAVSRLWPAQRRRDEQRDDAKRRCLRRLGQLDDTCAFTTLWDVCQQDDDLAMRFTAGLAISLRGDRAFEALHDRITRGGRVAAALAPPLAQHCADPEAVDQLCALIDGWAETSAATEPDVHHGLAAGLRWQSNHCRVDPALRERLGATAQSMLAYSDWWSALALIQALSLWQLSHSTGRTILPRPAIDRWLARSPAREHAFVKATRTLCCCALRSREPGRFLWIDESLSIRRIGSGAVRPTSELWLAPTGGWLSLAPRAQQLLADVVLLANLSGSLGSDGPLPRCLIDSHYRSTVLVPSDNGGCCGDGGCASRGDQVPLLGDISASFARSQQRILKHPINRRRACAPWQRGRRKQYYEAWVEAARAAPE